MEAALVGRERELEEISSLLAQARTGAGGLLSIVGVAGVGKTVLLRAAADMAGEQGFEVLRASPAVGQPGRLVWAQLLRDGGAPDAVIGAVMAEPGPLDLDRAARELVSAGPRLIAIDDLDRAGSEALGLLSVLAARATVAPTVVVVASASPLGMGKELRLGPLSEEELARVVASADADTSRAVFVASGGLPGPALELAGRIRDIPAGREVMAHLAINAVSRTWFLGVDSGLIRLLETAIGATRDDAMKARLLARLARELLGDPSAAQRRRRLADEALRLARQVGDQATLAEVLDARLGALWDPSSALDRLETGREIVELAGSAGDSARELRGLFWRFVALMELGRVVEAEGVLAEYERLAEVAGDLAASAMAVARRAMLAILRGRFAEGDRLADQFVAVAHRCGLPDAEAVFSTLKGTIVVKERGDRDWAAEAVVVLMSYARRYPGHFHEATAGAIMAWLGRTSEASLELERCLPSLLQASGPRWLGSMADLAVVAALVEDTESAAVIRAALLPYSPRLAVFGGAVICLEPVAHFLGMLEFTLGMNEDALRHFEEAIRMEQTIGALPHQARSLWWLSKALHGRGEPADAAAAVAARDKARSIAERVGLSSLLAEMSAPDEWLLTREGEDWLLAAGTERVRMRHSRGLDYLRALLAAPGRDIAASDLVSGGAGITSSRAGPTLDRSALAAYRRRLDELDAMSDRADRTGDAALGKRAEAEREALLTELRHATGLGRRPRTTSPEAERARVNVTRTLRATLDRIAEKAPKAAAHLQASIRTGGTCRYQPAAGGPARWRL